MTDEDDFEVEEVFEQAPDDAASPKQKERKDKRIARERRETEVFWSQVFATPVGRRAMWELLKAGGYAETAFACGPNGFPQPEATWFKAGAKDYAERIYVSWQLGNFEQVHLMHCENDSRFAKAQRPINRTDD